MKMEAPSPFKAGINCKTVDSISTSEITSVYKEFFQTDVSRFFSGIDRITIQECPVTGLEFFYPTGLDGDSKFYEDLSKGEWYYQTERWENRQSLHFIKEGDRVLEIGAGSGHFGLFLKNEISDINYCGLELNQQAVQRAMEQGLDMRLESSYEHFQSNALKYDVVCSFQVFEHVSNIAQLYQDAIGLLKPGGLLLVAVPNNEARFLRRNSMYSKVLNMPPHHVNLFTPQSLEKSGTFFGLKTLAISKEPLMPLNRDTYLYNLVNRLFMGFSIMTRAFWRLKLHYLLRPIAHFFRNSITGHTVFIAYRKP
ncbi:MAG: class I SAM-dependent methyltransferase [Bacteroidota bacterium]